ncbi:DUF1643 domain-containing protein [Weissella confusa]|uniref:DUF1643 domain-containing protein n=1 Tax=Weissella confusa TaxID=1583 RepID=UPI00223BD312|nr:DUF1643 domain-containing protein [Weissella confusa]
MEKQDDLSQKLGLTDDIISLVGHPNEMQHTIRKMYGVPHQVSETVRNGVAYSVVQVEEDGLKNIVAIGLNPRHADPDSQDGKALEPARREIIRHFKKSEPKEKFSRLVMLDLFAARTETSGELRKMLKASDNVLDLVGRDNLNLLELALKDADFIFLGFGGDGGALLTKLAANKETQAVVEKFYTLLSDRVDDVYWLGDTKLGYPMHTGAHGFKTLRKIERGELRVAMGLSHFSN